MNQIGNCAQHHFFVLSEVADAEIAVLTQESAHFPRLMAMVHKKLCFVSAYGASPQLFGAHGFIIIKTDAVYSP